MGRPFYYGRSLPSGTQICTQERTQSPVVRLGFCIFSVLNQPMAGFYLSKGSQDSRLSPPVYSYIRALSASFKAIWMHLQAVKSAFCCLLTTGQFHIDHPLFHLHVDLEAKPFGEVDHATIAGHGHAG